MDLDRLQSWLLTSELQRSNPPLFQLISQLIKSLKDLTAQINAITGGSSGGLASGTYLTWTLQNTLLPNSKQLLAGDFIAFDDTVAFERTVSGSEWSVLTNGDVTNPELIFADGDVIMTHVP